MSTDTVSRLWRNRTRWPLLATVAALAATAATVHVTGVLRTSSAAPAATARASGPPPPAGYFRLRPSMSYAELPDDVAAARLVHRSSWEIRPENARYNATVQPTNSLTPRDHAMRTYDPRRLSTALGGGCGDATRDGCGGCVTTGHRTARCTRLATCGAVSGRGRPATGTTTATSQVPPIFSVPRRRTRCGRGSPRASETGMGGGWIRRRLARLTLGCSAALLATSCSPAPLPGPAEPPHPRVVVSLTFNDGLASQYSYARPVLDAHRMPATFYLASGWLDAQGSCCMAWWQVDELYREGHEIGGMGVDHEDLTALAPGESTRTGSRRAFARLRRQVCDDRQRLLRRGYDTWSFAYPEGTYAAAFPDGSTPEDIVRSCGYLSARAVGGLGADRPRYANELRPADPFALRTPDRDRKSVV